jgi:hypothetical protein
MKKLLTVALLILCIAGSLSCKAKKSDQKDQGQGQFGNFSKQTKKEPKQKKAHSFQS